jgi:hypothetical protein
MNPNVLSANISVPSAVKYRRMKEKFGTFGEGDSKTSDKNGDEAEGPKAGKKKSPAKKGGAKKRKLDQADDEEEQESTPVKDEQADVRPSVFAERTYH